WRPVSVRLVRVRTAAAATWLDQGTPWLVVTVEDVAYNVDVSEYIRSSGLQGCASRPIWTPWERWVPSPPVAHRCHARWPSVAHLRQHMPPPFPGMDPYLEHPALWPGVHNRLIAAVDEDLSARLLPRYYVEVEERV